MTLGFALSKVLQILLRLWGIDTVARPTGRGSSADEFARATVRRIYNRNGVKVSISARSVRNRE